MNDLERKTTSPSQSVLWLALIGIGVAWGTTQLLSKLIVSEGHHPVGITFAATIVGALLVSIVMMVRGVRLPLSRRHLIFYAVCGLSGTALPNSVSYAAMAHLPVGVMSIIMAAVPMMTFVGSVIFRIERPVMRRAMGLGLGLLAVLVLVVPEASLPSPDDAFWVGFALITGLSYTFENIFIAKAKPEDCGAFQILCGLSFAALAMMAPVALATDTQMAFRGLGVAEISLVVMTILHLVSYGGFVWLISQAGPVFAAQVAYIVTLTGVGLGIAVLDESHSAWVWLSLGLMLVGLVLVQPRKRE